MSATIKVSHLCKQAHNKFATLAGVATQFVVMLLFGFPLYNCSVTTSWRPLCSACSSSQPALAAATPTGGATFIPPPPKHIVINATAQSASTGKGFSFDRGGATTATLTLASALALTPLTAFLLGSSAPALSLTATSFLFGGGSASLAQLSSTIAPTLSISKDTTLAAPLAVDWAFNLALPNLQRMPRLSLFVGRRWRKNRQWHATAGFSFGVPTASDAGKASASMSVWFHFDFAQKNDNNKDNVAKTSSAATSIPVSKSGFLFGYSAPTVMTPGCPLPTPDRRQCRSLC
ncbi:hypothetical protein ACHAXS_001677 [Conticribra weissflogii]